MKSRPKLRKTLKWTALSVSIAIFACWVGSRWYGFEWRHPSAGWNFAFFTNGLCGIARYDSPFWKTGGFVFERQKEYQLPAFRWGFQLSETKNQYGERTQCAAFPLWLPLSLSTWSAAWLWRRDARMSKVGACKQCGYDFSGLPGTACPECGTRESNL